MGGSLASHRGRRRAAWGRLNSHNVKKVVWLAEEIGLPYERRDIGGAFGFTDEYLAMNPNRLIPTIEDKGLVLWESNAILRFLAARYSDGVLWPTDPAVRAIGDKRMWVFSFADAQRGAFHGLVRHAPDKRDPETIARSARAAGEHFGIADIPMGVYAHTFFTINMERPPLPHVEAWYQRLTTWPGYGSQRDDTADLIEA